MMTSALLRPPELSRSWTAVWRRNQLVWRKLAIASLLGNVADPLLYMVALGFGIGAFVPEVGGMKYIAFLGTGMVCQSAMFTSSFEAMYSAFSRMHVQRTWDAIINAPVSLDDVVFAEWIWAASKAVTSTAAILAVIVALGFGHSWFALWIIPLGFLVGLTFGAFGLVMNALAPSYDFFTYFFTLVLTPGLLLSGVFFPVAQMPAALQDVANLLPLKHADRSRAAAADGHRAVRRPAAPRGARRVRRRRLLRRAGADAPAAAAVTERFFAPCPRGLETALAAELTALGGTFVAPAEGGVAFAGPLELAYHANLESRLASRILWQVAHGGYRDADELYALAKAIDWGRHFTAARTLRVDVAATRSPLTSLEFATLRVKDAVCDRFRADTGERPSIDKERPDVRVHAYLTEREATLYLDTSGDALFKRGWRRDTDVAPLRENLAAGVLALAGWTPGTPLLDPMCGSGTIAIEAALIAADLAPGLQRTFGFQKLAWYDGPTWQRIRQRARDRMRPAPADALDLRERHRPARGGAVPPQRRGRGRRRRGSTSAKATCWREPRRRRPASWSPIRPTASGSTTRPGWRRSTRNWAMR